MEEKNETGPLVEPRPEQQCKQARPHDELIAELLDSRRLKTEREHAAAAEIENLYGLLEAARAHNQNLKQAWQAKVDALGLAITNARYPWTPEMRAAYEMLPDTKVGAGITATVTKEMIGAAHDVMLAKGDFVLSAALLERIYLAMDAVRHNKEVSGRASEAGEGRAWPPCSATEIDMTTIVQILGPSGAVHYTRPVTDPMIGEALKTPGYAVRWPGIFNTGALDELPRECRGILTAPPEGLTLACPQTEKVPNEQK